ncbi:MAG TPA: response regulator [Burkholderiaceae bacterium]|nr:response regulator [Burkholderiaceae bacterium]
MNAAGKVFLVDDEPELRQALTRLLKAEGLDVEGFGSASEFLARVAEDTAGCLVLDLAMPGLDGLDLQQRLAVTGAKLGIVFLTGHGDIPTSVRAIKAGALDFLTKPVRRDDLLRAVHAALDHASVQRAAAAASMDLRNRYEQLTPREREVFRHVIAGKLNKVIASDLGTAEQTIKVHRARVMEKLAVDSVADLVRAAQQLGLSPAP